MVVYDDDVTSLGISLALAVAYRKNDCLISKIDKDVIDIPCDCTFQVIAIDFDFVYILFMFEGG